MRFKKMTFNQKDDDGENIARTAKGEQCKRTTCQYAPFCASHKAYRIDQSTIPGAGRGGFAARLLKRGDTIANYTTATIKKPPAEFKAPFSDKNVNLHTAHVLGSSIIRHLARERQLTLRWG